MFNKTIRPQVQKLVRWFVSKPFATRVKIVLALDLTILAIVIGLAFWAGHSVAASKYQSISDVSYNTGHTLGYWYGACKEYDTATKDGSIDCEHTFRKNDNPQKF